jgi:beta-phosphoglucomutase
MSKIKAVIFDMDGVLIDAKDWHYEALNRALNLFGFNISRYDHVVTFDGLPTRNKLEMLTREQGLPRGLHSIVNQLKQIYTMELVYSRCKPVFHHEYALSKLRSHGYAIAVASNSIRNTIEVMMRCSNLSKYLDLIVSNEDVTKGKPDPEIYRRTMTKLGVSPEQCLVIEDNEHGIAAARGAGAHLLIVRETTDVTIDAILERISAIEAT